MKTYKPTTEKLSVDNYPYGSLRTTAFFSVEFKKSKGFRNVFQTINPKNGVLNKEKKGTYSPVMLQYINEENGHVGHEAFDMNGAEEINKGCEFMNEHFDLFTTEQIKNISGYLYTMLKVTFQSMVVYCGSEIEALKPFFTESLKNAAKGYNTGENVFGLIKLDIEKIEATKKPDFNPFVTVTHTI